MPEFCCKKEEGSEVTRFGFRCTVYILGQSNHSICCLFCYTGLNWFISCFGKAKCAIDLISAQTSEKGIKCKVLSLLEACFGLITFTFHENSNHGWENYWKSGVRIPALGGQSLFFNHFWISCFTNQISIKTNIFNMFLFHFQLIKQDIKKWLNSKIHSFMWRIWKEKEKRTKSGAGIWTPDFQ